jgi:Lar family restriction alleviation protein
MNNLNLLGQEQAPTAVGSGDLLGCPHCGEKWVSLLREIPGGGCQVMCRGCGARSAVGKETEVVASWNRRVGIPLAFCFCPRCGDQMNPKHDASAA